MAVWAVKLNQTASMAVPLRMLGTVKNRAGCQCLKCLVQDEASDRRLAVRRQRMVKIRQAHMDDTGNDTEGERKTVMVNGTSTPVKGAHVKHNHQTSLAKVGHYINMFEYQSWPLCTTF